MAQQPPRTIHHSHTTPRLLSPTWRKVEELDDGLESDSEWEAEETCYLTLDFGSLVSMEAFEAADSFQLLEENAIKPLARVGAQIFQGRHEELIGSELFFLPPKDDKTGFDPMPPAPNQSRITFEPCNILSHEEAARRRTRGRKTTKKPLVDPNAPKRGPGRPKGSKNKPKPPGFVKVAPVRKPKAPQKQTEATPEDEEVTPSSVRRSSRPVKPSVKRAAAAAASASAGASRSDEEQPVASGSGTRRGD